MLWHGMTRKFPHATFFSTKGKSLSLYLLQQEKKLLFLNKNRTSHKHKHKTHSCAEQGRRQQSCSGTRNRECSVPCSAALRWLISRETDQWSSLKLQFSFTPFYSFACFKIPELSLQQFFSGLQLMERVEASAASASLALSRHLPPSTRARAAGAATYSSVGNGSSWK